MPTSFLPTPEQIFGLASAAAMLAWLALALSPAAARWTPIVRRLAGRGLPLVLAGVYALLIATHGLGDGGFGSMAEVKRLFDQPTLLVAGWLHYLAFDLFVGVWIAQQADDIGLPHLLLVPLLALTFLFGPAGWLAFTVMRATWRRARPAAAV